MNSKKTETSKTQSKGQKQSQMGTQAQVQSERSQQSNQKKCYSRQSSNKEKNTQKSFFLNDYMKKIIKEKGSKGNYYCDICIGKPELKKRSIYRHIIDSSSHNDQITKDNQEDHAELVRLIKLKIQKNKQGDSRNQKKIKKIQETT